MQLEMLLALTCELLTRHSTSADRGDSFPVKTIFLDTWQTNLKKLTGKFGNWLQTSRESCTGEC